MIGLLVLTAMMALLAAIAVPNYLHAQVRAKLVRAAAGTDLAASAPARPARSSRASDASVPSPQEIYHREHPVSCGNALVSPLLPPPATGEIRPPLPDDRLLPARSLWDRELF